MNGGTFAHYSSPFPAALTYRLHCRCLALWRNLLRLQLLRSHIGISIYILAQVESRGCLVTNKINRFHTCVGASSNESSCTYIQYPPLMKWMAYSGDSEHLFRKLFTWPVYLRRPVSEWRKLHGGLGPPHSFDVRHAGLSGEFLHDGSQIAVPAQKELYSYSYLDHCISNSDEIFNPCPWQCGNK